MHLTPPCTQIVFAFVLSKCFCAVILLLLEWLLFFFVTNWAEPAMNNVSLNVIGHTLPDKSKHLLKCLDDFIKQAPIYSRVC